jgi:alpha-tubulin suppressor-like RCC1 family protein
MRFHRLALPALAALALAACGDPAGPGVSIEGPRLAVGEYTACALDPNGQVLCWGNNTNFREYGQARAVSNTPVPVSVPRLGALSTGIAQHTCGLTTDRDAVCWGRGHFGEMGRGAPADTGSAPGEVTGGHTWARVSVGRILSCGLDTTGDIFCWGLNQRGELGDPAIALGTVVHTPTKVVGGLKFTSVATGWLHTCGIAMSGTAYCWGDNTNGQLGIGVADTDTHPQPVAVMGSQQFKQLALSGRATCGIAVDDRLYCWGYNGTGQLADGTTVQRNAPTPVASGLTFTAVSLASGFASGTGPETFLPPGHPQGAVAHGCAIATSQALYCWGWNGAGQLGTGGFINTVTPTLVNGDVKFTAIALGGAFSCGMSNADVYCWGANFYGQAGNGSFVDVTAPARVSTPW